MGTLNPKERLDEIQSTGRRQRAAAFVAEIKRHGESVRDVFAKGAPLARGGDQRILKLARIEPRGRHRQRLGHGRSPGCTPTGS